MLYSTTALYHLRGDIGHMVVGVVVGVGGWGGEDREILPL